MDTRITLEPTVSLYRSAGFNIVFQSIAGGIYDGRLLAEPVKATIRLMPNASLELPYEGAKEMLLVDDVDNRDFLTSLFESMYEELPIPKLKKKK